MTDDELIAHLRLQGLDKDIAAADRIEELVNECDKHKIDADFFQSEVKLRNRIPATAEPIADLLRKLEAAEAKLARAVEALRLVTDACDEGQMASMGAGGMTIDAQIRRSVYNKVPAWPIEEARVVLDELEKTE
jgi:hypothetical protein